MPFRSQYVRSHLWVRRLGGDPFSNEYGMKINEKFVRVVVRCFCFDQQAKALIRNTKQVNSKWGCDMCQQKGEHIKIPAKRGGYRRGGRNTFPESRNLELRTDASLRARSQAKYHKGPTPLARIPHFNLALDVPTDYLHSTLLGTMRRLLGIWLGTRTIWASRQR